MLEIKNLNAGYGSIPGLFDFSCTVSQGEVVSVVGSNGSGKSTLLKAIAGILQPTGGEIVFMGQRIDGLSPHKIVRRGISLVPEGRQIFGELTVQENLRLGSYILPSEQDKKLRMEEVIALFPVLEAHLVQRAETLSVGEQQMLAIARALMSRPKLLLVDELSFGLAPVLVEKLMAVLRNISGEVTILLVEQNVQEALEIADRGYVIQNGRTALSGPGASLLESEIVTKAYMGM